MSFEAQMDQQTPLPQRNPPPISDNQMHVQPSQLVFSSPLAIPPQMQLHLPQAQGISDTDVIRIATQVKLMLSDEIERLVTVKVQQAIEPLKTQLQDLATENADLKNSICELEQNVFAKADELEQYSRRHCVRVSGISERPDESTTQLILDLSQKHKLGIKPSDIDRSHRIVRPNPSKTRDIIVKVTNYDARQSLLKGRAALRAAKEKVFVNEDLTQHRKSLAYSCRTLVKARKIQKTWTYDGTVFIQDMSGYKLRVLSSADISKYE